MPLIIGEIGINHNGDINLAKKLIDMSIRCGCGAVKFQKRVVEKAYPRELLDAPHDSPWGKTYRDEKMGRELSEADYDEIDRYCKGRIDWLASSWDLESQVFLRKYNLKYNKIASKMLANKDLVDMVAEEGKHTFVSTGLNDDSLIEYALSVIPDVTLMHCVSKYPCSADECNLSRIEYLKERFGCSVGYSSHFAGIMDKAIAVVLGAEVIECHVTLDRAMYGADQSSSLEERGLGLVVRDTKLVGKMLQNDCHYNSGQVGL